MVVVLFCKSAYCFLASVGRVLLVIVEMEIGRRECLWAPWTI